VASSNPFQRDSQGWGVFIHRNHAARRENSSIMVGMFVSLCLCLASQKSSEREFFIPAGMHLGVNNSSSLTGALWATYLFHTLHIYA